MGFFKNQKNKYPDDYNGQNLVGYVITGEPMGEIDPKLQVIMEKMFDQAKQGRRGVVERIKKYIKKYPKETALKNYLYVALRMRDKDQEAYKVLEQTIEQHPDYVFGKINLAGRYIEEEEFDKVPELLGEHMDIKILYPERDVFHFTEVHSFLKIAALYYLGIGDIERAENRLELMDKMDEDHPDTKFIAAEVLMERMKIAQKRLETRREKEITVDSFPTVNYPPTTTAPTLENTILEEFYQQGIDDFPNALAQEILALPRATLISDLEKILIDSIQRFEWFRDNYEEFINEEQEFPIHALYFLAELKASESLDKVLDVLRQGKEFLNYWYSDSMEGFWAAPFYQLAEGQLEKLKQFVLEPNGFVFARLMAAQVVEQVAFHQANRRDEAIQWFKDVMNYHLDHAENEGIIDTDFISWTISYVIHIRAKELLPVIEKLWEKEWILEDVIGDLELIKKDLSLALNPSGKDPMPNNIDEFYSRAYLKRRAKSNRADESKEEFERMINKSTFKLLADIFSEKEENRVNDYTEYEEVDDYTESYSRPAYIEPFVRKKAKIGRNDPCPCGSGKKYKKCCL